MSCPWSDGMPRGAGAQFGDTITITLNPAYKKQFPTALNEFGIPIKERYRNEDPPKFLAWIQQRSSGDALVTSTVQSAKTRRVVGDFTLDDVRCIVQ